MYKINDIVKLNDGKEVKIINLPTTFMSNGSYEVSHLSKKFWVKPETILYKIEKEWLDDLNNYFEVIQDKDGINLIPKGISDIELEDENGVKKIVIKFNDGRKHSVCNIFVGDTEIIDNKKISKRPVKKKKSKIVQIFSKEEDEIR